MSQGTATKNEPPPEIVAQLLAQAERKRKEITWVAIAETWFSQCKQARMQFERQWFINMAFHSGRQYLAPVSVAGSFRLRTPTAPAHRVRLVINKIRKVVRTEHARLTSSRPIPTVVPATNEREDLSAALVGEQLLKSRFRQADFEQAYREAIWWTTLTGVGFLKQYWDGGAKDYECMTLPPRPVFAGQPIPDDVVEKLPELKARLETPIPSQGKICGESVNPFLIYVPDLMSTSLEAQPYVIHAMTKSPQWVYNRYGLKATPDAKSATTTLDTTMLIAKGADQHYDSVLVKEVWVKPGTHPDFPEGGVWTIINGKMVQCADKWPLPYPEYPFYKLNGMATGGFYGESIIVDLIPLQKEYNKTRSKAVEIKNLMGVPRGVYQAGSMNPRKINTEAGQWIPVEPGYEMPTMLQAVNIPESYNTEVERISAEFDDLAGQHDLTQNGDPASGTAMAFLKEQDDELLTDQTASIEYAMQYMGGHYLKLASQYWDDDRVVRIAGKNQNYEALKWKKDSLKGNTDVRVQTGSALPQSKAAKQAFITEMMQNGFLAPEVGLEILDMADFDRMMDEYLTDKRQAMRENIKMSEMPDKLLAIKQSPHPGPNGEPPFMGEPNPETGKPQEMNGDSTPFQPQPSVPVNSYDNHDAHIKWHNQYRKTEEFELLSDAHKQDFELHVQAHQFALMTNQLNMQGQIVQNNGGAPTDPMMGETGGQPLGQGEGDPQFAEDPANMDAATSRARAVDARTQTGQFSNG